MFGYCRVQGLVSVVLSLRKKPVIRYEGRSENCKKVAMEYMRMVDNDRALFDFRRQESVPLLLIVDRRSDPVQLCPSVSKRNGVC